jgi:hypothetical protein
MVASTSRMMAAPIVVGLLGLFEGPCGWVVSGLIQQLKRRRLQGRGHQVDPDNERASIAAFAALRHLTLTV